MVFYKLHCDLNLNQTQGHINLNMIKVKSMWMVRSKSTIFAVVNIFKVPGKNSFSKTYSNLL